MVKIGMMIGDRYEILEKIGTGGMSDVYKAKCHKLNRYVAVKVLKQEFSENANFVSKFRIEAQAAAGLMHANIVNVYDVGEENGIYYIVMELVEGITLKKYIEKKSRLSYKEAVSIAIQISMGIEAAHNNHIIHRDIKPQNIIISKDGKVKVTDFGIAKAATSNTITSNVMGSVHYTSPEQARGGYSDEKSDIYSLGITLFEMLTGRVPFNGETTVAIAIKQIQEDMPSPREYVPEIPVCVEGIVLKCCQKSPDRRYQNMQELIADLKQSLITPDEDFVMVNNGDVTGGTRMITDSDMAQIKLRTANSVSKDREEPEEMMRLKSEVEPEYDGEEPENEDEYDYEENPRMERITTWIAIILGILICVAIIWMAVKFLEDFQDDSQSNESKSPIITDESGQEAEYVEMVDVTGINVEDAKRQLTALGLVPVTQYTEHDTIADGIVISADVSVGEKMAVGSTITLTVSTGINGVTVPDLWDKTYEEAERMLTRLGLSIHKDENYSDTVEAGYIISQSPQGGMKVGKASVVTLTVSKGKEEVKIRVPNLVGLSEQDGTVEAIEAGLQIGSVARVYSSEVPEDYICYQSYSHGSYVKPGTVIDIKVSQGPENITYKYNASFAAPSVEEAPGYVSGSEVALKLVADNGQILLDTKTTSFPKAANFYGLTSSGGTLTMTYTVSVPGTITTDPVTGEQVITPGTNESRSFTRRIEFVRE